MRIVITRKGRLFLPIILALGIGVAMVSPAQSGPNRPATAAIDPAADELLHKMSDKIAQAKQLTITGKRTMDPALAQGKPINLQITCELSLQRPNQLMARITGKETERVFYYNENQVSLFDKRLKFYATVNSGGTIEEMLDGLHERYGFTPPLADFLVQDPYADLTRNVMSGRVLDHENVGGKECHHLLFTQAEADWELWLATEDLLPRKFVMFQKSMTGRPRLEIVFNKWDLAPKLDAELFTFTPPKDAEKIEMLPLDGRDTPTSVQATKQGKEQ